KTILSKPVFVFITPFLIVAMFYFKEGYFRWLRTSTVKACGAYLISVALALPGVSLWFGRVAGSSGETEIAKNLLNSFIIRNPLVSFDYFPAAMSLLAAASVFILYKNRQGALLKALISAAAISLAVNALEDSGKDFIGGQTLAAIFILAVASEGFQSFVDMRGANLRVYLVSLGLAFAGTAAYNFAPLLDETNAAREDRFVRESVENLEGKEIILLRQGANEEQRAAGKKMIFPDYLVEGMGRSFAIGIEDFNAGGSINSDVYFFACYSCYSDEKMLPACKEIFDGYKTSPVVEKDLPLDFDSAVRCGLYKIEGKK
ncbi:MAG: hypothetical protein FJ088_13095, partial [Deltaproteobacteria bacterium]|nr:hypothetical protein [Deltaproteobacteria bacterium]